MSFRAPLTAAALAVILGLGLSGCVFLPALAGGSSSEAVTPTPSAEVVAEDEGPTETEEPETSSTPTETAEPTETEALAQELTLAQENAIESAESYLDFMGFSRQGLIDQLEWEGYSLADAEYAVDALGADWREQAAIVAESYLDWGSFSRQELYDQLVFEGFTPEEAEFGVAAVGY